MSDTRRQTVVVRVNERNERRTYSATVKRILFNEFCLFFRLQVVSSHQNLSLAEDGAVSGDAVLVFKKNELRDKNIFHLKLMYIFICFGKKKANVNY